MRPQLKIHVSEAVAALQGLVAVNQLQIRRLADPAGRFPSLIRRIARGEIVYQRRDPREEWKSYQQLLEEGEGDCEDLAAALVAELRCMGDRAWPYMYLSDPERRVWHVVVYSATFGALDPSRAAGMP